LSGGAGGHADEGLKRTAKPAKLKALLAFNMAVGVPLELSGRVEVCRARNQRVLGGAAGHADEGCEELRNRPNLRHY